MRSFSLWEQMVLFWKISIISEATSSLQKLQIVGNSFRAGFSKAKHWRVFFQNYGKCPTISNTLFHTFWPKFYFLCSCFLLPRSNFFSFPQYFQYISYFRSQITYLFVKCVCFIYFLNSTNLICRGTDISKYFRESLGLRDNESRLYLVELQTM